MSEAVLQLLDGIVLGLVIEKPSYGYEIYERFVRQFGEILSTSRANVYGVLRRLENEGYIAGAGRSGSRGRPRVNFRATGEGVEVHLSWLVVCLCDPQYSAVLSRLTATGLRGMDVKLRLIARFVEQAAQEACALPIPEDDDSLLWELLIELRRRLADAKLEWGAYARSLVLERGRGVG